MHACLKFYDAYSEFYAPTHRYTFLLVIKKYFHSLSFLNDLYLFVLSKSTEGKFFLP